jgi:NodT family efflux transporter outer membrane factor (OMF) lipoprotein
VAERLAAARHRGSHDQHRVLDVSPSGRLIMKEIRMRTHVPRRPVRATWRAPLALAALALAGCAVGPNYRAPAAPAIDGDRYAGASAALPASAPSDHWWTEFGDPVLNSLVDKALADSPDLAAAEARVRAARALARATGASFYPQLSGAADVSRDKLSRNGENLALIPFNPPTTQFTDFRVGLDMSWELDLAGKTRRDVEAALARFGSAAESRNDARVVVAAEVASAYIDARVAAARAALARRLLAILEDSLRMVRLQQQAGLASDSDVQRADSDRAASSALPAIQDASGLVARVRLAALTGESSSEVDSQLAAAAAVPSPPETVPVGLPSDLLRRRPDIRRAERDYAAATAEVGSAVAARFPRISLVGDAGLDSVRSGDLVGAASRFWNISPQLNIPLFSAGRLRRQVDAAEATREASLASYRSTVLQAFADTETAVVHFASDRDNATGLAASAASLEASFKLERTRYDAGDISMLDLLGAEQASNRAADRRIDSAGQASRDFAALNKALGGGWQGAQ